MTRHVDAETLASYRAGDVRAWQAWRIRAHLSRCAECSALNADLAQVTTLLASVPEPPMPDYLSARIQGALAHEAALRAASTAAEPVMAGEPAIANSEARRPAVDTARRADWDLRARWRRLARQWLPQGPGFSTQAGLRVAAGAAALVVLGVGGYEVAVHAGGSSRPSSGSPAAAPRASRAAPYLAPQVSYGPALRYQHAGRADSVTPITTNTDFTASQLDSQVARLSRYGTSAPSSPAPASGSRSFSSSAPPAGASGAKFRNMLISSMAGCVNRIAAGSLVVLVDADQFQGKPAVVIVTEASQSAPKHIWVVGTSCSASRSDILDRGALPASS